MMSLNNDINELEKIKETQNNSVVNNKINKIIKDLKLIEDIFVSDKLFTIRRINGINWLCIETSKDNITPIKTLSDEEVGTFNNLGE